jgi:hypothetical protein
MARKGRGDKAEKKKKKAEDNTQINSESQARQYVQPPAQDKPIGATSVGIKRKNSKFDLQDNTETVLFRPEFAYDNKKQG